MRVAELQSAPWTKPGEWPAEFALSAEPRNGQHAPTLNALLLTQEVARVRSIFEQASVETQELEGVRKDANGEMGISIHNTDSDEAILGLAERMGPFAENMLDRCESLTHYLARLERIRSIVWNADAERLVSDMRALVALFEWHEKNARLSLNQIYEEYERRHPEFPPLPFEPVDLGPTNAARLPEVI